MIVVGYVIGFSVFTGIPSNIFALAFLLLGYGAIVANNFFHGAFSAVAPFSNT